MKTFAPDKFRHSKNLYLGMITYYERFPEGWRTTKFPNFYYYKDWRVKSIDRGYGMFEMIAQKDEEHICMLGRSFHQAMKKIEEKCKELDAKRSN